MTVSSITAPTITANSGSSMLPLIMSDLSVDLVSVSLLVFPADVEAVGADVEAIVVDVEAAVADDEPVPSVCEIVSAVGVDFVDPINVVLGDVVAEDENVLGVIFIFLVTLLADIAGDIAGDTVDDDIGVDDVVATVFTPFCGVGVASFTFLRPAVATTIIDNNKNHILFGK